MPQTLSQTDAIILSTRPHKDNFLLLHLFTPSNLQPTLLRISKKATKPQPDLFDHIQAHLSIKPPATHGFLQEYSLIHRHSRLSRDYSALTYASNWANILIHNLSHIENPLPAFRLTLKALQAFESLPHPSATYIKTLYIFVNSEGFPIKQHWFASLPHDLQSTTLEILNTRLRDLASCPNLNPIMESLHLWIESQTDFYIN